MTSSGCTAWASPAQAMCMCSASPSPGSSPPQVNVTVSPGLSSTTPSRSDADAQLRPGQVLQDRHLAAGAARGVAHALGGLGVLLGGAVGEVQPGDVHPRLDEPGEHLGFAGGGADGGDDLGPARHGPPRYPRSRTPCVTDLRPDRTTSCSGPRRTLARRRSVTCLRGRAVRTSRSSRPCSEQARVDPRGRGHPHGHGQAATQRRARDRARSPHDRGQPATELPGDEQRRRPALAAGLDACRAADADADEPARALQRSRGGARDRVAAPADLHRAVERTRLVEADRAEAEAVAARDLADEPRAAAGIGQDVVGHRAAAERKRPRAGRARLRALPRTVAMTDLPRVSKAVPAARKSPPGRNVMALAKENAPPTRCAAVAQDGAGGRAPTARRSGRSRCPPSRRRAPPPAAPPPGRRRGRARSRRRRARRASRRRSRRTGRALRRR